ncbi:MAG: YdcF family protein [Candidatus Berkelbacteria bacterium]|nr:YdcF family protein [Candidatus Berkelbacteria bacterium]
MKNIPKKVNTSTSLSVNELAQIIWDYHHLNQKIKKAQAIMVLGSHDLRVAEFAIKLFKEGYAPLIIFSGGLAHQDDMLSTGWQKSEAETMAEMAIKAGVSEENILIENQSQNTGDNFRFTKKLLEEKDLKIKSFIFVQKPYMERRVWATFKIEWPEKKAVITSPPISFEEYCNEEFPKEKVINIMLGDLQRIKVYSKLGYQKKESIPRKVWQAYKKLIALGFNKHLIKS